MKPFSEKRLVFTISFAASLISGLITIILAGDTIIKAPFYPLAVFFLDFVAVFAAIYYFLRKWMRLKIADKKEIAAESRAKTTQPIPDINNSSSNFAQTGEIDRLKEMEKYRKEFLGNVSHELKTPIFNIQGYVSTLLDGGLEDPSINRKYLERADKSINRMISIVEDLETITRLESGELKLQLDEFDIVQLIDEVIETQEMRSKTKGIKLKFDKSFDKPIMVLADKKKIFQVISNLMVNSILYGKENGKTEIAVKKRKKKVYVEVSDNGMGISEYDLPRIFERFYRVDKSRSREQGGTGLGLAIVKHILEAHGESITVQSMVNKGTAFEFTLSRPTSKE